MKPLIVGEAPSKNEITERPIEGRVGKRLATLAGMTLEEFLAHFDRVNLLHERQDTDEYGFQFDEDAAHNEATVLTSRLKEGQVVLLLGYRVARAFNVRPQFFLEQVPMGMQGAKVIVIPHPSGLNRWWNIPGNVREAKSFMWAIVERTR